MKAKKSYGQHFLTSESLTEQIANSLILTDQYTQIVEVGPGKGMLTKYLLKKKTHAFTAVEADADMVTYLKNNLSPFRIIQEDILKVNLSKEMDNKPFGLIGNFPYNISSQILFNMLDNKELIPEMVGMFQKEVAERVVSKEGSKVYGVISVLIQAYYDCYYLFEVDKSNFNPPPKVQSAVIRCVRKENQDLGCEHDLFRKIVKTTFGQRRKMLRNTMKTFVNDETFLANPMFTKRPEELGLADFVNLTKLVEAHRKVS